MIRTYLLLYYRPDFTVQPVTVLGVFFSFEDAKARGERIDLKSNTYLQVQSWYAHGTHYTALTEKHYNGDWEDVVVGMTEKIYDVIVNK